MENYKNIYNSICRLCLCYSDSKKMIALFDTNSQDGLSAHGKAVSTFASISLNKQDCFPSNMCLKCLHLLKQAIHFKLVAESSDYCLKRLDNSAGNDSETLKENIIEYTMLKFYFPTQPFNTLIRGKKKKKYIKPKEQSLLNDNISDKVMEVQINCNNSLDDDIYDTPMLESNSEQIITPVKCSENTSQILNKIENLITSNICETSFAEYRLLKRRKKNLIRSRILKARLQHKLKMQKQRSQPRRKNKSQISQVCNICNKVLANQFTYQHHMQRHNGCRYICEHCGKGFPVTTELNIHRVTRHGTGPHLKCTQCPFKAPRKFDLIEHERIHTGERPYACDKCGLTFRRRGIWRKHLIYHNEKTVQCTQCPKKFHQRSAMLAHANNIHERVYVYLCSKCDVTYAKPATVRRHMIERHGIPREMQGKIIRVNKGVSGQGQ